MDGKESGLSPGWLERQFEEVQKRVAKWPPHLRATIGSINSELRQVTNTHHPARSQPRPGHKPQGATMQYHITIRSFMLFLVARELSERSLRFTTLSDDGTWAVVRFECDEATANELNKPYWVEELNAAITE